MSFILESDIPGKAGFEQKFEYLREMLRFLPWRRGDAVFLGEANVLPEESKRCFGEEGSGIHLMFNFYVNQHLFYTLATADTEPLVRALEATCSTFHVSRWAHFLHNHDELRLQDLRESRQVDLMAEAGSTADGQGRHRITLDAYGYRWFRTGDIHGFPAAENALGRGIGRAAVRALQGETPCPPARLC